MLDEERATYAEHSAEWAAKSTGRFVVVKGDLLMGIFASLDEALAAGVRTVGLEPFLVRQLGVSFGPVSVPALELGLLGTRP